MLYKKKEMTYYSTMTQLIFWVLSFVFIVLQWLLRPQLIVVRAALWVLAAFGELSNDLWMYGMSIVKEELLGL